MLRIEQATRKRTCCHCGRDIPAKIHCLRVSLTGKSRSFCARCVLLKATELFGHHDIQKIREDIVEERLT